MVVVRSDTHQGWYLGECLSKADFERYHFSGGWVFPGRTGFSRWFRKEFGDYRPRKMLVELAKIGKGKREEDGLFGAYLWESRTAKRGFH
jgi:hypothetical protein